ncbi:hypothetical protein [Nonomuraea sp. NPDC050643]|uniref:hypothetical protein n=1 Tax=Nonomuraea sp. NPDC050643 TaxID=3155660 RepID=UPI0033E5C30D
MTGRRVRIAALAMGLTGALALPGGLAQAASARTYITAYQGPFTEEAPCNLYSFHTHSPPDVYASACFYTVSGIPGYDPRPGWWFQYRYSID